MSTNFTGVTFAQQKVAPSDDAIIRRATLTDGILTGCALSYSGSTLTMASGQLLACGRQFKHPSPQNWAVVDATSGYARLLLSIDMTRTSTKENFDQIVDTIEYASALDGFPELEQADINEAGTIYQLVACVVSLGTGGITGIVEQLGPCECTGGGGGLNFKVVGGTTQPADPAENTIWVDTAVEITSYAFGAEEPAEPEAGMVWITTGTSSTVAFNALKKNAIQVCPLSAMQYVDGAWMANEAKIYQGNQWLEWEKYLYYNGSQCTEIGGEWVGRGLIIDSSSTATAAPTIAFGTDSMTITQVKGKGGACHKESKIDLTNVNTLRIKGHVNNAPARSDYLMFCVWSTFGANVWTNLAASCAFGTSAGDVDKSVDVSALLGEYYIGIFEYEPQSITVTKIEIVYD